MPSALAPRWLIAAQGAAAYLLLSGCGGLDWREEAANDAVRQIRNAVADEAAAASYVQVVGDDRTGQVCGKIFGKTVSTHIGTPARFIVYIDRTAGPWIEGQHGHSIVSDERFDFAWANDCLAEGWKPSL